MPAEAERVRLIEGELKADLVQAVTSLPTISFPGATNWRLAIPVLKELCCRTAPLAFDADASDKPIVARSLSACADALREAGYSVEVERWNVVDGKGLDDLLANGKQPEVVTGDAAYSAIREILATATSEEEPGPPSELDRLQDVLAIGGAEALFLDKALMQSLANLRSTDLAGFFAVRAQIGKRVKLREFDTALRAFSPSVPSNRPESSPYFESGGCINRNVMTKDGQVSMPLCNFSARIVEDLEHDDGGEKKRFFAIEGGLADGTPLPRAEVRAESFPRMEWIAPIWGSRAVIYAGMGVRDHLRAALQVLSDNVPRRTVYSHTGWRSINGSWVYLHAGGAIGKDGVEAGVSVSLPEVLSGFDLPDPPTGPELIDAVRASLGFLRLGPLRITLPLLAAAYRAVLGDTDFSLHLVGPTSCYKSETAALVQQHFGSGLNARKLPANWSGTANALEALAFAAKDAVLVVDEFCPSGSAADLQSCQRKADRIFRSQGNRQGRQRMRADTTLQPEKPPRGLLVSNGEDTPRGQSLRARLLALEISPGDLGPKPPAPNPTLTACQRDAAAGKYAAAMACFIRWLAPQLDNIRSGFSSERAELRDKATSMGQHARTPCLVADLAVGLRYFLAFAVATRALSEEERDDLWKSGWDALVQAAAAQTAGIETAEPAGLFLRLLQAALVGGYAYLADEHGAPPLEPQRWGWRRDGNAWEPRGRCVGWVVDGEVYLEPEGSYAAVQRLAADQGEPSTVSKYTLRRRLAEKGFLAATDRDRGKLTTRKTLQGARREVLHVAWKVATDGTCDAYGDEGPETREPEGESGPKSCAEPRHVNGDSAQPSTLPGTGSQPMAAVESELGRMGRS
jgi:hypothetical protein